MGAGESHVFSELLPLDYTYLSTARTSGRGSGVATVFKKRLKCAQFTLSNPVSSFEVNLASDSPLFCAVVYRPPRYNKNFIDDFSNSLAKIRPKFDRILIVGDFSKPCTLTCHCRVLNSSPVAQFSDAFNQSKLSSGCFGLDIEVLPRCFDSTCQSILGLVAPLKIRRPKHASDPWLNETTRAARRECRRAERMWKKDKLHVSFQILKDSWYNYQKCVKSAKNMYFGNMVTNKPHVLFKMVNAALNVPQANSPELHPWCV